MDFCVTTDAHKNALIIVTIYFLMWVAILYIFSAFVTVSYLWSLVYFFLFLACILPHSEGTLEYLQVEECLCSTKIYKKYIKDNDTYLYVESCILCSFSCLDVNMVISLVYFTFLYVQCFFSFLCCNLCFIIELVIFVLLLLVCLVVIFMYWDIGGESLFEMSDVELINMFWISNNVASLFN